MTTADVPCMSIVSNIKSVLLLINDWNYNSKKKGRLVVAPILIAELELV